MFIRTNSMQNVDRITRDMQELDDTYRRPIKKDNIYEIASRLCRNIRTQL